MSSGYGHQVARGVFSSSSITTPAIFKDLGRCLTLPAAALCRLVVVIDAPWAGVPTRFRWHNTALDMPRTHCRIVTFIEQNHSVCAPLAHLGTRAIRWMIRQLRIEGATIAGLARQLATTWNTVWSHIKPCLQAASEPARFAGVQVRGVDEHVWHHQDRRRRGPRELTGIVDHSREGSSHGPLEWTGCRADLAPYTRTVGRSRKRLARGGVNRDARSPSRDSKNAIAWPAPRMQPACAAPVTSSHTPGMPQVRDAVASSKRRPVTVGARGDPLYHIRLLLRAWRDRLMKRQQERLREAFTADEAHN